MTRVLVALAIVAALLIATQIVLPRVAENRLRSSLEENGEVLRVQVSAFPAIKLLFKRADRVEVHVSEASSGESRLADLLAETRNTGELDARADSYRVGPLRVRDLRLDKDGDRLRGEAAVTLDDLNAALPPTVGLRPVATGNGQLILEASAGFFGARVALRARLSARDGALVVAPDVPLGGLASLTVFADPRVLVTGVGASERADGYTFTAEATLA